MLSSIRARFLDGGLFRATSGTIPLAVGLTPSASSTIQDLEGTLPIEMLDLGPRKDRTGAMTWYIPSEWLVSMTSSSLDWFPKLCCFVVPPIRRNLTPRGLNLAYILATKGEIQCR